MSDFNIEEELKKLPTSPGVYLMHKFDGEVIYVGKAKNLKNRVKQYFSPSYNKTSKIEQMVSNIDHFEYIVVDNELESLILESNFIKEYRPRYNTLLKDDKNYPYIKITTEEKYPRVFMVHRKGKDSSTYFGPYMSGGIVKEALSYIKENYKLRLCKLDLNSEKKNSYKTCLYYHLDMCLAPCVNKDDTEYKKQVEEVKDFLSGNTKGIIKSLESKMEECSEKEEYEKAAIYRDKIVTINEITEKQKIVSKEEFDKDIVGMYRNKDIAMIQIFEVRDGSIIDRNNNILNIDPNDTDSEVISSFIKQYYNETYFLPKEIWIPVEVDEKELFDEWLSRDKKKCKLVSPKKGDKDKLVKLASTNAKIQYDQRVAKYVREEKELSIAYDDLKKMTGLDEIKRFESFDISNTAGVLNVASMVVWEGKGFKKNDYRKFKLKTITGPDDYGSLEEVLTRRIERFISDDSKFNSLPSIFLIDGGLGQVNVVEGVLNKYQIDIPVMGMVKDDKHRTRGLVYNGVEIDLSNYKELFKLITKIQDETHRFAIEYHRSLRSKEMVSCEKGQKQKKSKSEK
ncbi:MAG: excinuclease ABC subunit UvrC [Lachnospiraceae bacterium]|nr:excinuclease ABC subunit UvrC [Lachnospiraceae bacterium]